jgi:hypothetical protein
MMAADEFAVRVARVRDRFASNLNGKIANGFAALDTMARGDGDAVDAAITTHRMLHEMCGVAPTLGFDATGKAARSACYAIREAANAKRAATPDEIAILKSEIKRLQEAATADLQTYSKGENTDAP